MTKSKYHPELYINPCPNCTSTDVEESGDDFDGMVNCNYCGLATFTCTGTKSAINIWNKQLYMESWEFLDFEEHSKQSNYEI